MIEWFTSTTEPWTSILDAARVFAVERGGLLLEEPAHASPPEILAFAEQVMYRHRRDAQGTIVVASTSDLAIFRILRRIRNEYFPQAEQGEQIALFTEGVRMRAEHFRVHCLSRGVAGIAYGDGRVHVSVLRLREDGEFRDLWPEGFFDERGKEIFG